MERCTVISDRAELETFASPISANSVCAFSMGYRSQKSRAEDADFCDMFRTLQRPRPEIRSIIWQTFDIANQNLFLQYTVPFRRTALVRARQAAVRALRQARQQLSGFLLRHGCHYHRPAWTQLHRRWLASLKFDQAVHHIVLEDCIAAVEAAMARRDRLEAHIEAALPEWTLAPVVEALQALRGVRLVAAATLVAELGDITRFTNPRQLMAYLGLVPSEHSSGDTRRQGGITKAGNGAARRMLIEAAWSYRFPARISREQLLRQEGLGQPIRDTAWKAQERLCRRYRKLARAGKPPTVVTAAIARELAGFVWAIAKQAQPARA